MRRWTATSLSLALVACIGGCDERGSIGLGFDPNQYRIQSVELRFGRHRDVDVLFVVGDSPGMAPKQAALAEALPAFANQIGRLAGTDSPRHFHFGVVTADLGAGTTASGECATPGDDGILAELGRAAASGCQPAMGRYLDVDQATPTDNLPAGEDLATALGCLTAMGDTGCGYSQPLEAARRALTNSTTNFGFLRDDALLVVVFLVDQDDCSAPPESALFDPAGNILGAPGLFRCAAAGLTCGNPPHPPGVADLDPHSDCAPAPETGDLYGLQRYRDFFFSASGVKHDPNDVRLVMIAGPTAPVQVGSDGSGQPELLPSCTAPGDPGFTAQPGVRLAALGSDSPRDAITSVCAAGAGEYALGTIAASLDAEDGAAPCLPAPIANPDDPDCQVSDDSGAIPSCAHSGNAAPCWALVSQPDCLPIDNPRTRTSDRLALALRPAQPPSPTLTGRCQVLLPQD